MMRISVASVETKNGNSSPLIPVSSNEQKILAPQSRGGVRDCLIEFGKHSGGVKRLVEFGKRHRNSDYRSQNIMVSWPTHSDEGFGASRSPLENPVVRRGR
jgi:hypothetical protein